MKTFLPVSVTPCQVGQEYLFTNMCKNCENQMFSCKTANLINIKYIIILKVKHNAAKCFPCPSYANCSYGNQLFPIKGFYVVTTKTDDRFLNFSNIKSDLIKNYPLTAHELKILEIYSHYIFIKCERVDFKITPCKSIFYKLINYFTNNFILDKI